MVLFTSQCRKRRFSPHKLQTAKLCRFSVAALALHYFFVANQDECAAHSPVCSLTIDLLKGTARAKGYSSCRNDLSYLSPSTSSSIEMFKSFAFVVVRSHKPEYLHGDLGRWKGGTGHPTLSLVKETRRATGYTMLSVHQPTFQLDELVMHTNRIADSPNLKSLLPKQFKVSFINFLSEWQVLWKIYWQLENQWLLG